MKKLLQGIVEFRLRQTTEYREKFARLALGQRPDCLFIACSDSRVAPNVFASTNPGDLFVIRNVGNMVPPCGVAGKSTADESEAAAIEFALLNLQVRDIILCGHSECGAIAALLEGRERVEPPNLKSWLRHAEPILGGTATDFLNDGPAETHNFVSQLNVLQQMANLMSYPIVRERVDAKTLRLHGWWFELKTASVHAYSADAKRFSPIDEIEAERILTALGD